MTIMTGAGDRPRRSNGAPGRASPSPQPIQIVEAQADEEDGHRREDHAHHVDLHVGSAASRFQTETEPEHDADSTIRMPKAGRQPMKVPKCRRSETRATPAPARAEPSAPSAVACCRPW